MIETCHLQPPVSGPQSDPLLFGVAEALVLLFPIEEARPSAPTEWPDPMQEQSVEDALAA